MKIYRHLLASYLCVCLIPLLLSLFTMVKLEITAGRSLVEDQENVIHTMQQEMDQKLTDANNTAAILAEESLIGQLGTEYAFTLEEMIDRSQLIDSLRAIRNQQSMISNCFVYFFRSGQLITNTRSYGGEVVDVFAKSIGFSDAVMMDAIEGMDHFYGTQVVYDLSGEAYLLVLRNQYTDNYKEKLSCVGLMLRLADNLGFIWEEENSELFLLDQDGTFLYGDALSAEACADFDGQSEGKVRLSGEKYLYTLYPSAVSDLQYGFLTRKSNYYGGVYVLRRQLLLEVLVYISIGVLISVYTSHKNWSPFEQMMQFMQQHIDGETELESVESITRALQGFAGEKESLENRLLQERERKKSRYIGQFLMGYSDDPSTLSQYIEDGQPYRLLVLHTVHPENSAFFQNVPQEQLGETIEMLFFAIGNIMEEVLLERNGVTIGVEPYLGVILQEKGTEEDTMALVEKAIQLTEKALDLRIYGYISPVCSRISEAPKAMHSVWSVCYRDDIGKQEKLPALQLVSANTPVGNYSGFLSHLEQLSDDLDARSWEAAEEELQILGEDLTRMKDNTSFEILHSRCNLIAELLVAQLPEKERVECLHEFLHLHSSEEIADRVWGLFLRVRQSEAEAEPSEDRNLQWAHTVRSYIESCYADAALSAGMIADYLQMNLSTLSRRYKSVMGHGVLDEIHLVRLAHAKELLLEGKTVRETAEQIGYVEARSLVRAFKRYEEVTPTEFVQAHIA